MFCHLGTAKTDDAAAGVEETTVALGVEEQEVAHNDVGQALGESTDIVFEGFTGTIGSELGVHGLVVGSHLAEHFAQGFEFGTDGHGIVVGNAFEIVAIADALGGGDDLQLGGAFVDAEDASMHWLEYSLAMSLVMGVRQSALRR